MKKTLIIIGALLLVIFDQLYIYPKQSNTYIPTKAYQVIKEDNDSGTVLEIPYSVRDGFNYIGYVHAISPMNGQLLHQKPIIGGYEARVNPSVFEYYKSLPFMGYTARIIDKGNYEPLKQQPGETKLEPLQTDLETIKNELNFLNIRYLLLKNNEKYSPIFTQIISSLDFQKKTSDGEYDLYERNFKSGNYDTISFGQDADYLHLAQGFSFKEPGFRWADEKIAKVFIKTSNVKKNKLTFELESFYQPQEVSIFVNNIKIKTLMIDVSKKSYTVEIKGLIIDGINDIQFTFSKNTKPSDIFPNDKDERALAAKFYSLKIE